MRAPDSTFACLLGVVLMAGAGCSTVPKDKPTATEQSSPKGAATTNASLKKVFKNVPQHRPRTAQKFNPVFWFGNVDDPVPPDSYRSDDPHRVRKWYWRNPCHNFMFYVIGIADKEFERVGRYPERVGNPNGGWNWAVCKYKCLRLPFISYNRGRFNFYCGWRNRGNFGIKINFSDRKERKPATPATTQACSPGPPPGHHGGSG